MNAIAFRAPNSATTTASQRSLSSSPTMQPPRAGLRRERRAGSQDSQVAAGRVQSRPRSCAVRGVRDAGPARPLPRLAFRTTVAPRASARVVSCWSGGEAPVKDLPVVAPEFQFSLVSDPLLRLQRAIHLAPRDSFGAPRRALLFALTTWLPIVIWAVATGNFHFDFQGEAILRHLGVHIRCLIAIPMFVLSEPLADLYFGAVVANFIPSGLIPPDERGRFAAALRSVERWRDSGLVWAGIVALVAATTLATARSIGTEDVDTLAWAHGITTRDFGAAWALYVVRPLFLFLAMAWIWRLIVSWILLRRIARLDLELVASHPDGVGGIGFVELHSAAFPLVIGAISSVACAQVAHQILSHGAQLKQFEAQLISLVVLLTLLFLAPLTSFSGSLRRVLRRARFQYGTLAARQVR